MYVEQDKPDAEIELYNGSKAIPILTLADESGGRASIIIDDRCFVLCLKKATGKYSPINHWFFEAAKALALYLTSKSCLIPERY